jgi:hypothetical protein
MYDDCHCKRADDHYQHFRVHLEIPRFDGVIVQTGRFQAIFAGFLKQWGAALSTPRRAVGGRHLRPQLLEYLQGIARSASMAHARS